MTNTISKIVTTHRIIYKDGDQSQDVRVTKEEASEAAEAWNNFKPVPVPNSLDDRRSVMLLNPKSIVRIKRYRYLDKQK